MQRTVLDTMIRWFGAAGVAAFPSAALAATDVALLPRNLSPWNMFVNADIVVQAVMVGLAFASLVTWTIWLAKTIEVRRKTATARRRLSMLETDTVLAKAEQESRAATTPWRRSSSPPPARPLSPAAISTTASRSASRCGWNG